MRILINCAGFNDEERLEIRFSIGCFADLGTGSFANFWIKNPNFLALKPSDIRLPLPIGDHSLHLFRRQLNLTDRPEIASVYPANWVRQE